MANTILSINNLRVSIDDKAVLNGISFTMGAGEIHILMGPNGSGKSTLAHALMGDPSVHVVSGNMELCGEDITHASVEERAKKGLYLGFQNPVELSDVGMMPFLRSIHGANTLALCREPAFREQMTALLARAGLASSMLDRNVNEGFSGGEKKRNEMFQLSVLNPRVAIMDEVDSGLDKDGARMVEEALCRFTQKGGSLLFITHSMSTARALCPQKVYIMEEGRIAACGDKNLLDIVETRGFEAI